MTAAILTALKVGGTILSVGGELAAGQAEANAAKFNAKVQEQQAAQEREAAAAEASDFRRAESRKRAASIAARGGTGTTMAGSPLLVDESVVREIALGSSRIVQGGEVRATRLEQGAKLSRMKASAARTASYFRAGESLLSGASSWASENG